MNYGRINSDGVGISQWKDPSGGIRPGQSLQQYPPSPTSENNEVHKTSVVVEGELLSRYGIKRFTCALWFNNSPPLHR